MNFQSNIRRIPETCYCTELTELACSVRPGLTRVCWYLKLPNHQNLPQKKKTTSTQRSSAPSSSSVSPNFIGVTRSNIRNRFSYLSGPFEWTIQITRIFSTKAWLPLYCLGLSERASPGGFHHSRADQKQKVLRSFMGTLALADWWKCAILRAVNGAMLVAGWWARSLISGDFGGTTWIGEVITHETKRL